MPLVPLAEAPPPISRLNPIVAVGDRKLVMMTQVAAAVEVRELGPPIASLAADDSLLPGALDLLLTGV